MAKHEFMPDGRGGYKVVDERDSYPYCCYVACLRCDEWFCDNGCDGKIFEEECPSGQMELFSLNEL